MAQSKLPRAIRRFTECSNFTTISNVIVLISPSPGGGLSDGVVWGVQTCLAKLLLSQSPPTADPPFIKVPTEDDWAVVLVSRFPSAASTTTQLIMAAVLFYPSQKVAGDKQSYHLESGLSRLYCVVLSSAVFISST